MAARAGARPVGQCDDAHRRRGFRAGAAAAGRAAGVGRGIGARLGHRGGAAGDAGPAARRCDAAHLRPVPRCVPGADRAVRRRRARGRGARRGRRLQPARAARRRPCASSARRPAITAPASPRCRSRRWRAAISAPPISPRPSFAYGRGREGAADAAGFAARVAAADAFLHTQDHRETDLLDGPDYAAHEGGFAAAAARLGARAGAVSRRHLAPRCADAAHGGGGSRARGARARRQSALDRRHAAARLSRCGRDRAHGRCAVRLRRDAAGTARRQLRPAVRGDAGRCRRWIASCATPIRRRARRCARASPRRGRAACGTAAATTWRRRWHDAARLVPDAVRADGVRRRAAGARQAAGRAAAAGAGARAGARRRRATATARSS